LEKENIRGNELWEVMEMLQKPEKEETVMCMGAYNFISLMW
jgi:hypothetical protein